MGLEGLTKVKGNSFEDIKTILDRMKLEYKVTLGPRQDDRYFRDSMFDIASSQFADSFYTFERCIGEKGHNSKWHIYYYAKYRIEKNFDFNTLHGNITFEHGHLVERVGIKYQQGKSQD